jgi:hypothetical protein
VFAQLPAATRGQGYAWRRDFARAAYDLCTDIAAGLVPRPRCGAPGAAWSDEHLGTYAGGTLLRRSLAAVAMTAALVLAPAAAASASSTLPATNTAHRCVSHTTGLCGWTHHQRPANRYETARCRDFSLSYSRHSSGTCSHHGVRYWFK